MLQEISNLSNADPKISKNAALNIIQHVSENKGELSYLVKRLIGGMQSVKITTRTGYYTTLCALLSLHKVDPFDLFDLMQKSLITNKESTKKERRLIYIARVLVTGAIFRASTAAKLAENEDFLRAALKDLIDLAQKKSTYFLLVTPFLSHLLHDKTLTQATFDKVVWPSISSLFSAETNLKKAQKKKKDDDSDEDDDQNEALDEEGSDVDENSINFCCKVQIALDSANGGYKVNFEILKDYQKIAKALLASRLQFEDKFLNSLSKQLATSSEQLQLFWEAFLENIKSTQFELLCLAVRSFITEASISPALLLSKKLLRLLLSVFKLEDKDFIKKSKDTVGLLLKWEESHNISKKQRKAMLKLFFDNEDPPNLLHEYKLLHAVIRPFLLRLSSKNLESLHAILVRNLQEDKLGPRMAIVYLQTLGKIAQCAKASAETQFEIGKRLLSLAMGKESLEIKNKADDESTEEEKKQDEGASPEELQAQFKKVAMDTLNLILSSIYSPEFMNLLSSHITDNTKDLTDNENTLKIIKDIKKALKKIEDPQLEYILRASAIRSLLDEGQTLSHASETVQSLIEIGKKWRKLDENEDNDNIADLMKYLVDTVLREANPAFSFENMFNKLLMEGKITENTIQVLAESIDIDAGDGEEDDDDDDESVDDSEEEKESEIDDDEEGTASPHKRTKLDPAQIEKLKAQFAAREEGSDSDEESINLDEATEEELKKMDSSLAKVFAVKKSIKEEGQNETRAVMRTLRLVELYIKRNVKAMPVSSLLILLMPAVHSLQNSLKLKNSAVPTRVIALLDSLLRVRKFTGVDQVVEGTFGSVAGDLYEMAIQPKNKLIRELLEHSVIVLTKCFLQKEGKRGKKEEKKFVALFCKAVDVAKKKMKRERNQKAKGKNKRKIAKGIKNGGEVPMNTSRFVRLALETFPEWEGGVKAIKERIALTPEGNGPVQVENQRKKKKLDNKPTEDNATITAENKPQQNGTNQNKGKKANSSKKNNKRGISDETNDKSVALVNGTASTSPKKKKIKKA